MQYLLFLYYQRIWMINVTMLTTLRIYSFHFIKWYTVNVFHLHSTGKLTTILIICSPIFSTTQLLTWDAAIYKNFIDFLQVRNWLQVRRLFKRTIKIWASGWWWWWWWSSSLFWPFVFCLIFFKQKTKSIKFDWPDSSKNNLIILPQKCYNLWLK